MDMDSSQQNWLAFSLSNHHLPTDSSQLCLLEAFNAPNPTGVVVRAPEENGSGGATPTTDFSTVLNCASPKLEDFLGGANGSSAVGAASETCQLTSQNSSTVLGTGMYESELKTIAASFLRGISTKQTQTHKQLAVVTPTEPPAKKLVETFGQRTSIYRGVTRHRWTGRYEAHLWDNTCRREGQSRKGRQVYLGGYDKEDKAARAYDLAALKYWGPTTTTNFPVSNYEKELEEMKHMTRQEFVASLRRKSSGFSRGASIYRGVTRHHQHGRWQARIGRVAGNKDLYLGTFSTQEEAAEAYDIAAIKFRGLNAVTNFDISRYDVKSIANCNLPIGGMSNKSKTSSDQSLSGDGGSRSDDRDLSSATSVSFASQPSASTLSFGLPVVKQDANDFWSSLGYQNSNFHNAKPHTSATVTATPLFQSSTNVGGTSTSATVLQCTATHFNVDFPTTPCVSEANKNNGYFNGGYSDNQQQSNGSTQSAVPLVTRIAINSSTSNYEAPSYGNWVSPSLHSFQPAKPNLSVFQTPIFGME